MAGDWIPMRTNLEDDPTVIFIARTVRLQPDHVVGKLHNFWSWADSHTVDGRLLGIDADWINQRVHKPGFAEAMAAAPAPWLEIDSEGVTIIHFEHWFGTSAKRRLMDTRRKQSVRSLSTICPQTNGTKTGPPNRTEQKRRVIAPALGAVDFQSIADKAREITAKLGECGTQRNKRLLLGACVLSGELGAAWLENAVRDTREAHADKPYAYLRTVLTRTADDAGVDFRASVAAMKFPGASSRATSISEES